MLISSQNVGFVRRAKTFLGEGQVPPFSLPLPLNAAGLYVCMYNMSIHSSCVKSIIANVLIFVCKKYYR